MALLTIEHGRSAYWADFVAYGSLVAVLAVGLAIYAPLEQGVVLLALILLGVVTWTLMEYALHRFVLHGLEPFAGWHAQHHERPTALLSIPTSASIALFVTIVFLPALFAVGLWRALALTLGVLGGYLAYSLTHHAVHHCRTTGPWMTRRKRWHARHHQADGYYGVSSSLWDRVFGSASARRDVHR